MKTWVVTGGAASGKSTFCQLLRQMAPEALFFSSDACVHQMLSSDSEVIALIVDRFGERVLHEGGGIDRAGLRQVVFADEGARKDLEMILHPRVRAAMRDLAQESSPDGKLQLLIAEVPLFYETNNEFPADLVILVAVSAATQRRRIIDSRGLTAADADRILSAQLPLSRKLELAEKVIWNEGESSLLRLQAELLFYHFFYTDAR